MNRREALAAVGAITLTALLLAPLGGQGPAPRPPEFWKSRLADVAEAVKQVKKGSARVLTHTRSQVGGVVSLDCCQMDVSPEFQATCRLSAEKSALRPSAEKVGVLNLGNQGGTRPFFLDLGRDEKENEASLEPVQEGCAGGQ